MDKATDLLMMRRALQLARLGYGFTSPNPMVGAVIATPSGRVIGEGWHRRWGGPHAEVNAVASVRDPELLRGATVYVTLEPCSHFGKTPPCANLLIEKRAGRVVVGCLDPFPAVSGRGVRLLRDAGIEVRTGVLEEECRELNRMFIYAHTHRRPYVMLKWAQSADGYVATAEGAPVHLSTPATAVLMHRLRVGFDAIAVGTRTVITDDPHLTCRLWPARRLRPVLFDAHRHTPASSHLLHNPDTIRLTADVPLPEALSRLYAEHGIISLMVEGGPTLLRSFIGQRLYQAVRIEVSPLRLGAGVPAPEFPLAGLKAERIGSNTIFNA